MPHPHHRASCAQAALIILAIIGGLVVTSIAGCVGCIGCAALLASGQGVEHFNREQITAAYADDIATVHEWLNNDQRQPYPQQQLPDSVIAVFHVTGESLDQEYSDIYQRHQVRKTSHWLVNGAGTLTVVSDGLQGQVAGYRVEVDNQTYMIALRDWKVDEQVSE